MTARFLARYLQKLPRQPRTVLFTVILGLSAGAAAVAFQVTINWVYQMTFMRWETASVLDFMVRSLALIVTGSLLVGLLLNKICPEARGSGIPQVKLAFWKEFGYMPWRVVWVKFLAGIASIGSGCSLGREGPTVQLASGLTSNLAGALGEPKQRRRLAAASGAAAGLAAAFNTPLAAITFVLEEVITDLNSRSLGGVLFASVLGAFVVQGLVGKQPAFELSIGGTPSWPAYAFVPVVAAAASVIGVLFQKFTLGIRSRRKGFGRVPNWWRPVLGGLITWGLGVTVFLWLGRTGVFGLGYDDLSEGLNNDLTWQVAGILLGAKFLATVACYGFGGCGGIFSPTLFLGGMSGVLLAGLMGLMVPLSPTDQTMLAVVGMSACLGAVVRAPITGILIVFEMTHEFALVPALMVTALISQAISRKLVKDSFYEAILVQDGHNVDHIIPPRDLRSWHQLPVSAIANFQPVSLPVSELNLPAVEKLLGSFPYHAFPVVDGGRPVGLLTRQEAQSALKQQRAPKPEAPVLCPPNYSIRRLQQLLIESPSRVVLLQEPGNGHLMGLITLHDLLRAEVAMVETAGE